MIEQKNQSAMVGKEWLRRMDNKKDYAVNILSLPYEGRLKEYERVKKMFYADSSLSSYVIEERLKKLVKLLKI